MLLFFQISAWVFLIHMFSYAGFYCIAAGVSRERSSVALFEDPRFLFLGDNKSWKRCAILLLGHVGQGL